MSVSYCDLFPLHRVLYCLIDILYSAVHQIVYNYNDTLQFCFIIKHKGNHFLTVQNKIVQYCTVQ